MLDFCLDHQLSCGGWCPEGRLAEDGPIDLTYPLKEINGGYESRTRKNVEDSDGTLVFYERRLQGGTEKTVTFCKELAKPHIMLDIDAVPVGVAIPEILSFVAEYKIRVLNVAGPRQSQCPSIYSYVKMVMQGVITNAS